ncbi:condensation protein [Gordonia sp. DT30]|uniref:condensation protein n=1 Tax=Gordonia sp. DT30 TaxID=3416546 RepID=UPI003CF43C03
MKLASLEHYSVEPGRFVQWRPRATADAVPTGVAVSENERFHLDSVRAGRHGWLTLVVDFSRAIERDRLDRLVPILLARHDALRSHFVVGAGDYERHECGPDITTTAVAEADGVSTSATAFTDEVMGRVAMVCNPLRPLDHFFSAVARSDSTTVICAFDHAYVDARSLTVLAGDISDILADRPLRTADSGLDAVRGHTVIQNVSADDPRLTGWQRYLEQTDWQIPDFPLDLGVAPGTRVPMRTRVETLLSREASRQLGTGVRRHGGRTLPTLLTCIGAAVHRNGGPSEMATIIPAGPSSDERFVAWVVENIPLRVACAGDVRELLKINADRLATARPLAEIGLTPVYQTFGDRLRRKRDDVFMVSYVDYTRWYEPVDGVEVRQLSGDHATDNAQWWLWRDARGIHVRVRYPATARADAVMDAVLADTASILEQTVDRVAMSRARGASA